jgi:methylglutaconyl-CoA hydratase
MTGAPLIAAVDARGVATLTLNRPDKGNAYNQALLDMLDATLARFAADTTVRVLVLCGSGKHFCAGADVSGQGATLPEPRATLPGFCRALDAFPRPTIALIQGGCIGGGLAFAACCDVAIAAREAFFALPEVRLGFAPVPLTPFLVRAMQPRALRRYLVSGERFDAEEALRTGLVHEVADAPMLEQALDKAISAFLEAGPNAAAAAKRALRRQTHAAVTDELLAELQAEFRQGAESEEAKEGRAAFRDKRKPSWTTRSG